MAGQFGPSLFFWVFILMCLYMLISSGTVELDKDGIGNRNLTGHYRMFWQEVQHMEYGPGALVLKGEGKRLVLPSITYWSGSDKRAALEFFDRKITELALTISPCDLADYKVHKNVKVKVVAK